MLVNLQPETDFSPQAITRNAIARARSTIDLLVSEGAIENIPPKKKLETDGFGTPREAGMTPEHMEYDPNNGNLVLEKYFTGALEPLRTLVIEYKERPTSEALSETLAAIQTVQITADLLLYGGRDSKDLTVTPTEAVETRWYDVVVTELDELEADLQTRTDSVTHALLEEAVVVPAEERDVLLQQVKSFMGSEVSYRNIIRRRTEDPLHARNINLSGEQRELYGMLCDIKPFSHTSNQDALTTQRAEDKGYWQAVRSCMPIGIFPTALFAFSSVTATMSNAFGSYSTLPAQIF